MLLVPLFRSTVCRSFASRALRRDPNRPALPLSAYFRFADTYRKENTLKGGPETMKKIGAAWKSLPEDKKKPFQTAYQRDRDKYTAELQKYKDSGALEAWKRDPLKPKAPQTAFFRYLQEFRATDKAKGLPITEVVKEGAKKWKTEDPVKKNALEAAYKTDKAQYTKALEQYKASGKDVAWKKKVGIWDEEQKVLLKKQEEKDKKRKVAEKAREAKLKLKQKEKLRLAKEKERAKLLKEKERARAKSLKQKELAKKSGKSKLSAGTAKRKAAEKQRTKVLNVIAKEKKALDKLTTRLKEQASAQKKKLAELKKLSSKISSPATRAPAKSTDSKSLKR